MNGINLIITFETKPELSTQFHALLKQAQKDLPSVEGCNHVRLFAASDNPNLFTLVENWDSKQAHQAHINNVIASGAWDAIAAHLSKEAVSHYYQEIDTQ